MPKTIMVVVAVLFLTVAARAQSPAAGGAAEAEGRLPVKRVVLYKNGVGYFEHSTQVRGNQDLNIDFTSGQLDDALKSLTVVDLGGGHIQGVRFNSVAPLSERLKTLRLPLAEDTSRQDFLNALRGTRVEVHSGSASAVGKLLSVETVKSITDKNLQVESTEVTLVTDDGEMRSFEMTPGASLRVADRELSDEVNRYLNLIGSAKAVDLRRLTISASGAGEREIFVSYISEVPVWKSTYRILIDKDHAQNPLLQGWAVVDNTIGEDWKDVQLSLIAGAPQSFVQNISQPMYMQRPEVPLPQAAMLTPQTHESAMNAPPAPAPPPPPPVEGTGGGVGAGYGAGRGMSIAPGRAGLGGTVKDQSGTGVSGARVSIRNETTGESHTVTSDQQGNYLFNDVAPGNSALFVQAPGFQRFALTNIYIGVGRVNEIHPALSVGAATQMVEVTGQASQLQTESASVSAEAVERQGAEAEAKATGDFFEYDLKERVTIGKNQSALVPILQERIDAEKVTLWSENSGAPLRALWLKNTSDLEFDAGSFNILEDGIFAGEGMLDSLRPGERRLISYAADPAIHIKVEEHPTEKPFSRVQIMKGTMIMTREERETRTFRISNSDSTGRDVIIEYPVRPDWKFAEGVKPEETTASLHRFRVRVEPKQGAQLVLEEFHPLATKVELSDVSDDEVNLLTEQKRMTPSLQQAIKRVLDQKAVIDSVDAQIKTHQDEVNAITSDQARIRENMKALKGSVEERTLVQRYTQQLNAQEDRLAALRSQIGSLQMRRQQESDKLDKILEEIAVDEKF